MYTRPRHSPDSIPSISSMSSYPSSSHSFPKPEDIQTWYTPTENFLRPDPVSHHIASPSYSYSPPPFQPPPIHHFPIISKTEIKVEKLTQNNHPGKAAPTIIKSHRTPHLPAEKNSALKAAKIAAECQDLGSETTERFKCHFDGCDKYFQRRYNLKVHVRKHTKETPYTCGEPGCGKKFMWRSSISHHLKAHNKRKKHLPKADNISPENGPGSLPDSAHLPPLQATVGTSKVTSYRANVDYLSGAKGDNRVRRMAGRLLPTSPISSGTNERFGTFGIENMGYAGSSEVGMEDLNFHGEQVAGIMFENMMHGSLMDGSHGHN